MRVVVVGTGRMGRTHLQMVRDLGFDVVGIVDDQPETLKLAGDEYEVPEGRRFSGPTLRLDQLAPDCVIVATTAPSHCEYTCRAAEAGAKFILCEKPMAISLEQCDQMVDACRATGALLAINHPMRFLPIYTEVRAIVASDAFGELGSITAVTGNVGMAMNGTHFLEMFRYMTDDEPAVVTAWFSTVDVPNPRGPDFVDKAGSLRVSSTQGRRFYLECGSDQGHGVMVVYSGRHGQVVLNTLSGDINVSIREEDSRPLPTTRYGEPSLDYSRQVETIDNVEASKAVLQALIAGEDYPTGEQGRMAVATLVASYVSDENGHSPVAIDAPDLPRKRVFPWA